MLGWVWHCLKCVRVLLHSLISFFLLLGRIVKHEKCLFTVQDHPVKHMSSLPLSPFNQRGLIVFMLKPVAKLPSQENWKRSLNLSRSPNITYCGILPWKRKFIVQTASLNICGTHKFTCLKQTTAYNVMNQKNQKSKTKPPHLLFLGILI